MQTFAFKDWQVLLNYLLMHRKDLVLVNLTSRRKSYRFQSLVFGDLKAVDLVIVPFNGFMEEQVVNLNNVQITAIHMNTELFTADCHLVSAIGDVR